MSVASFGEDIEVGKHYVVDLFFQGEIVTVSGNAEEVSDDRVLLRPPSDEGGTLLMGLWVLFGDIVRIQNL